LAVGGSALALALGATGGAIAFASGNAGIVEPESSDPEERGAAYGVEVRRPDGSKVDVFLDSNYKLLRITSNADG
jgi:hypothetical protein